MLGTEDAVTGLVEALAGVRELALSAAEVGDGVRLVMGQLSDENH